MKYKNLGTSDIEVSEICLGTMTWGSQNTKSEGHAQLNFALDNGVNFLDTAEMYPFGSPLGVAGKTEEIVGSWVKDNPEKRKNWVIATKITGEGRASVRDGRGITAKEIPLAVEGSLKRLNTDYIDLYQFHWPQRDSYSFQQHWSYDQWYLDKNKAGVLDNLHESLEAINTLVKAGKIREFGLSDDTVWGLMQCLGVSKESKAPRVQTIQNEYSLLYRLFETDWAEAAYYENVGLLAWSPLATGLLTGKYINGAVPIGSRKDFQGDRLNRDIPETVAPTKEYVAIANKHGINPAQMALAFVLSRPFTTSAIIGATNLEQLKENIGATKVKLSAEVLAEINAVWRKYPMPL